MCAYLDRIESELLRGSEILFGIKQGLGLFHDYDDENMKQNADYFFLPMHQPTQSIFMEY